MKEMNRYTIYCTETQVKKALELGAPIKINNHPPFNGENFMWLSPPNDAIAWNNSRNCLIPTAEQMIGWLEDIGIVIMFIPTIKDDKSGYTWVEHVCHSQYEIIWINSENLSNLSHKKVTLDAIDAALDYLIKNKK